MGWIHVEGDDQLDEHEGYVVGLERLRNEHAQWREFSMHADGPRYDALKLEERKHGLRVEYVQVVCGCGWRSQVLMAPLGTRWDPSCITFPSLLRGDDFDDAACRIWSEQHIEHIKQGTRAYGGSSGLLFTLAADIREKREGKR